MSDEQMHRELGVLAAKIESLEDNHGRELGEIKKSFAAFLTEERDEHRLINEHLAAMRTTLEVHLAGARSSRRNLATVTGIVASIVTAAAIKAWHLLHK